MCYIKPEIIIDSVSSEFQKIAQERVLILTSKSIEKINQISKLIFNQKNSILIDDVKPENPFSYIKTVYDRLVFLPTVIIAIGGGSVLDLGKAISISKNFDELKNNFYNENVSHKKYAKMVACPTTFGTGAEISCSAILYDDEHNIKKGIRGELVQSDKIILDFSLYFSASKRIKSLAGFDCLTHSVETYISLKSDQLIRYHAVKSLETIFNNLMAAIDGDIRATESMAIASMMMGVNLSFSSTCIPHRLQYAIGPLTKTSHAEGLAAIYKGWLAVLTMKKEGPFFELANELKISGDMLKMNINVLKESIAIDYTLRDFGIKETDIKTIAKEVSGNLQNDPYYKDINTIEEVIRLSL
jgi:alcohol dehydrogenase class IV